MANNDWRKASSLPLIHIRNTEGELQHCRLHDSEGQVRAGVRARHSAATKSRGYAAGCSRNALGETPVRLRNTRLKYAWSLKPT